MLLDELQSPERDEALGDRADAEHRVGADVAIRRYVRLADAAREDDLIFSDQRDSDSGNVVLLQIAATADLSSSILVGGAGFFSPPHDAKASIIRIDEMTLARSRRTRRPLPVGAERKFCFIRRCRFIRVR